jgi:hypothetical protein
MLKYVLYSTIGTLVVESMMVGTCLAHGSFVEMLVVIIHEVLIEL